MHRICILGLLILFLSGCTKDSDPTEQLDTIAPEVTFSIAGSSGDGTEPMVVGGKIDISIDAKDAGGIARVEAYIDETKVGEDSEAPFQLVIDLSSYNSKGASTSKLKVFTLNIRVTDTSGNSTNKEQQLIIDNSIPVITEVSLAAGAIINGNGNKVSFIITENETLETVRVYVNDTELSDLTGQEFEFSINTLVLDEGENLLRIEASDYADNSAVFEVPFIVDNTGPEISMESVKDGQVIDQLLELRPNISDPFSSIATVKLFLGEQLIQSFEETENLVIAFNPEDFNTGSQELKIKAYDDLGNESVYNVSIEIARRLVEIHFPLQDNDFDRVALFVFASAMDGTLLAIKEVGPEDISVILNTTINIPLEGQYMVTFAEQRNSRFGETNLLTTVQNFNRSTLSEINLKPRHKFRRSNYNLSPELFPIDGFWDDSTQEMISISGGGSDYWANAGSNRPYNTLNLPPDREVRIKRYDNIGANVQSSPLYLYLQNVTQNTSAAATVAWEDLNSGFVLNSEIFTSENRVRRVYNVNNAPLISSGNSGIKIWGYLTEQDFLQNVYHNIFEMGYGENTSFNYWSDTSFHRYRHLVLVNNYAIEKTGSPLENYTPLDWSIDFTMSGNVLKLNKEATGDILGKIVLADKVIYNSGGGSLTDLNGADETYEWSIIFDSQNTANVVVPTLPESMKSWLIYEKFLKEELEAKSVEISRYENIITYEDYLQKVIKDNNYWYLVSPSKETLFKAPTYINRDNFLID